MPVCVLLLSSTSGIVCNLNAVQSLETVNRRRMQTRILSASSMWRTCDHRKPLLVLRFTELTEGERAHDSLDIISLRTESNRHLGKYLLIIDNNFIKMPLTFV